MTKLAGVPAPLTPKGKLQNDSHKNAQAHPIVIEKRPKTRSTLAVANQVLLVYEEHGCDRQTQIVITSQLEAPTHHNQCIEGHQLHDGRYAYNQTTSLRTSSQS